MLKELFSRNRGFIVKIKKASMKSILILTEKQSGSNFFKNVYNSQRK